MEFSDVDVINITRLAGCTRRSSELDYIRIATKLNV